MSLQILLADDHLLVRQAIKTALMQKGLEVTAEASDGQQAVKNCQDSRPDIAILDISMPLLNGIEAAREIIRACPTTKIIILTMHSQERYLQESLRLGVKGYLLKANTADELAQAVRAVARGDTYISQFLSPAPSEYRTVPVPAEPL